VNRNDVFVVPVSAVRRFLILTLLIAIVAIGLAIYPMVRDRLQSSPIDRNAYQAVFLVTNQLYFAKVALDGDTYLLSDVYYLSQAEQGAPSQLLKRGGEPHGPREPMIVPARSVLFIENLRDDSPVVVGIKAFKSGQSGPLASSVPPAVPTGTARPSGTR